MRKIIGIWICIFLALSAITLKAEQYDTQTTINTAQPTINQTTIKIMNGYFSPGILIIDIPTNVTWINMDFSPHIVVADGGEFFSPPLRYMETFYYVFKIQHVCTYHDQYHPTMTGKIFAEPGGNQPPLKPNLQGPASGTKKTNYTFTAVSIDPEQSNVSYFFDWGDNTNSGWTPFVPTGTVVNATHAWKRTGQFVVKVQAKDFYANATSSWATLPVKIPVNNAFTYPPFLQQLFERLIDRYPLLRLILHPFFN